MQCSFAHKGPQFAVNAKFDNFSVLKHACTRAALLDVYQFVHRHPISTLQSISHLNIFLDRVLKLLTCVENML